jgi:hypothetical protein
MPTTAGTEAPFISPATPGLCTRRRGACASAETLHAHRLITTHQQHATKSVSNPQKDEHGSERREISPPSTNQTQPEGAPRRLTGKQLPGSPLGQTTSRCRGRRSGRDTRQALSGRRLAGEEDGERNLQGPVESERISIGILTNGSARAWQGSEAAAPALPSTAPATEGGRSGRSPVAFNRWAVQGRPGGWRDGDTWEHESQSMYHVLCESSSARSYNCSQGENILSVLLVTLVVLHHQIYILIYVFFYI